jgi:membrane associated rhomboid family serine protease/Tfp pilus assembly protein PilF
MLIGGFSPIWPRTQQLVRWGALSGEKVLIQHQWWRILSSAFIHIGAAHLVMNMWALWVLGTLAEAVLGTYLFFGVYIACAIAGSLVSLYWRPLVIAAGASGAIMGILGVMLGVVKFAHLPLPKDVLRSTTRSLVQGAVLTLVIGVIPGIDNAAHVGGLGCGLFIGLLLSWTRRADHRLQRRLRQICLIAPFVVMVPLGLAVQKHGEPWIRYQRASYARNAGQYELAEKEARAALTDLPHRTEAVEMLSEILFEKGDDAEAGKYLRQLINQNPRNQFAVNRLAAIELKEDNPIGARDLLTKTLPLQPRNAYGQVYLGRALQALNQDNEAIAHYREAIRIVPNMYDAELALAGIYEKHQQRQDALLLYKKASQVRPDALDALRGLARVYLALGMKPQADETIAEIRNREEAKQATGDGEQGTTNKK